MEVRIDEMVESADDVKKLGIGLEILFPLMPVRSLRQAVTSNRAIWMTKPASPLRLARKHEAG